MVGNLIVALPMPWLQIGPMNLPKVRTRPNSLPKVQNWFSNHHGGHLLVALQFTIPIERKKYTRR
jgi:macrodomain Ter protein organizer (MatP/YcbG family)